MEKCSHRDSCNKRPHGIGAIFHCILCKLAKDREAARHELELEPLRRQQRIKAGQERLQKLFAETLQQK
jgi:hypothetical protein